VFEATQPTGTARNLHDASKLLALDWHDKIELRDTLALTSQDFLARVDQKRDA
jgi:hypothetical protein